MGSTMPSGAPLMGGDLMVFIRTATFFSLAPRAPRPPEVFIYGLCPYIWS